MQQFRPDVKPPMWGPPDAIGFAVRANCERVGINPAAVAGYWPLLEGAGKSALDVVNHVALAVGANSDFVSRGVAYSSTNVGIAGQCPRLQAAHTSLTVLGWFFNIAQPANESTIFGTRNAWNDGRGFILDHASAKRRLRHQSPTGQLDIISSYDYRAGIGPFVYRPESLSMHGFSYGPGNCDFYFAPTINGAAGIDSVSHSSTGITASIRDFSIGPSAGFTSAGTVTQCLTINGTISRGQGLRLAYEPYTLLMPVARPLYFDLGSVEPGTEVEGPAVITAASTISASGSKQATSPATVTASASVGMGGVKGAVAPLNIVGSISIGTDGIKSTSSPATITTASTYGASGIKTIAGLDKEGPAVITASATVGMGGIKGGVGAAVLSADYAPTAGGTKGATGQAWFAATGEFYAVRGPDEVPITADEIGRAALLQARNYSAVLAKRNYTARL